jgi:hypothetical protein
VWQQLEVKRAYVSSLKDMWIMYASVGGLGFVSALFLKKHALSRGGRRSAGGNDVELELAESVTRRATDYTRGATH